MHKGDFRLLQQAAVALANFHQLPIPPICAGDPMLWRTMDKMMAVVSRCPEVLPQGMPTIDTIISEIKAARAALEKYQAALVLGHGDCKPSNLIMEDEKCGSVKLIDFELGGPNYRGFDLMKLFRTERNSSKPCMTYFLEEYVKCTCSGGPSNTDVSSLMDELERFEPLTWLEAAVFFLTLPQFKPEDTARWHKLAIGRWAKYNETKGKLFNA